MKDLLKTSDLTATDLALLLDLAADFKAAPHRRPRALADETVIMYFDQPSTRGRLSFEAAVVRLGATPIAVRAEDLQLSRGESVEDTVRAASRYCAAMAVRTARDADLAMAAGAATVPVINNRTDLHDPCQSLADVLTLREHFELRGLRVAYLGQGGCISHSLMEACALVGADLTIATPAGYGPDATITARAQRIATSHGGSVRVTDDPERAVCGAMAVATDRWLPAVGSPEECESRWRVFAPYRVTEQLVKLADEDAIFLHSLPASRGDEVEAEVIDGPRSVVFDQAGNRLHTEMALLYALTRGMLHGATAGTAGTGARTLVDA